MLTALKRMLIFYFLVITAGVIYFEVDGAKRLQVYLEQELTTRTGHTVKISAVGIDYWKPLSLELRDVQIQPPVNPAPYTLSLSKLIIRIPPTLAIFEMSPEIRLQLVKPKLEANLAAATPAPEPAPGLLPPEKNGFAGIPPTTLTLPEKPRLAFRVGITDERSNFRDRLPQKPPRRPSTLMD